MQTNPKPQDESVTATDNEKVVTALENGRLVAHVYGYEGSIDSSSVVGQNASTAKKEWEDQKPFLRTLARRIVDVIEQKGTVIRAVLLHGQEQKNIEVCPSDKRKPLSDDLVNEAKTRNEHHLLVEELEVTLTGALAKWALKHLPTLAKKDVLANNLKANLKTLLTDTFKELYKTVTRDPNESIDRKTFYQRMFEGGYNLPAVEVKK